MEQVKYVSEKKVAELTEIGVQTLRNDRHLKRGLPYIKKGRMVRYSLADVIAYMEQHKVKTE
jgi:hypothetical protein